MMNRKPIFETSGSSSYSIICDGVTDYITVDNPEEFKNISGGEYGWTHDELTHVSEKMSYAFTFAYRYGTQIELEMLRNVIRDFLKIEPCFDEPKLDYKGRYIGDWYIDQKSREAMKDLFKDEENLKDVLFSVKSKIVIKK